MLSEVSQRERQIVYDSTCLWNLKNKNNELRTRDRFLTTETKLMIPKGDMGIRTAEIDKGHWEVETSTYKISHEKYSIGNVVRSVIMLYSKCT